MRKIIFLFLGIFFLVAAILAEQFGIDNDPGWGIGRIAILLVGFGFVIAELISTYFPNRFSKIIRFISAEKYSLIAVMVVGIIYFWVAQLNLKSTRQDYNYYSELAKSFKSGQTHLAEKPSRALLALDNPYDYNLRNEANVDDFPWDVTFYNQKFYLYWGPSPAMLLTVLNSAQLSRIGDRHLVAAFASGLFLYAMLIIVTFFKKSLPSAPGWFVGLLILILGLTTPATIMLQESTVYPVAVFGSQFFFIGGCYWAYIAIKNENFSTLNFLITGLHWALALGTRITIAPVILWSIAIIIAYIVIIYKTSIKEILIPMAAIGIPLLIAATSLGWYNWVRFGSILETGFTYTLTGTNYTIFKKVFSSDYVGRNFNNYFFHPLLIRHQFPFLFRIEYIYTSERMGGLIFIAPIITLAFLPILSGIRNFYQAGYRINTLIKKPNTEHWLLCTFAGSAIIGIIIILTFFWAEMRYLEDFMPSLLLFTLVGVGRQYKVLEANIKKQRWLLIISTILGIITIIASTLVALKNDSLVFWMDAGDTVLKILKLK